MVLTEADHNAMQRAIEIVRRDPNRRAQIEYQIEHEGFAMAGLFAASICQDRMLHLKPWQPPPCDPWGGFFNDGAYELRDRLVAAGLSVFEPDPVKALAETERAKLPERSRTTGSRLKPA